MSTGWGTWPAASWLVRWKVAVHPLQLWEHRDIRLSGSTLWAAVRGRTGYRYGPKGVRSSRKRPEGSGSAGSAYLFTMCPAVAPVRGDPHPGLRWPPRLLLRSPQVTVPPSNLGQWAEGGRRVGGSGRWGKACRAPPVRPARPRGHLQRPGSLGSHARQQRPGYAPRPPPPRPVAGHSPELGRTNSLGPGARGPLSSPGSAARPKRPPMTPSRRPLAERRKSASD